MPSKAAKEAAALEAAMKQAAEDAQKLFRQHEKERRTLEQLDKADRDKEHFEKALEDDRLARERKSYAEVSSQLAREEALIYAEHAKHQAWDRVMDASWLPSVDSECDINSFLSSWREDQEAAAGTAPADVSVKMRCTLHPQRQIAIDHMHLIRRDEGPTPIVRQQNVHKDLEMCTLANRLADNIWREIDKALVTGDRAKLEFHRRNIINVYKQIMGTLDSATSTVLAFIDIFITDEEHFLKALQNIKFGVWAKSGSGLRSGGIHYPAPVDISIDPKDSTTSRLPRVLTKDNYALRAVQLSFDPFSVTAPTDVGQEYYALDCLIIVELLYFAERAKKVPNMDWVSRVETPATRALNVQDYPPKSDTKGEDHTIKVTFDVPENVVIRHRTPLIGKWNEAQRKWDPCGTSNYMYDPMVRKTSFLTSDLTTMAVIQEKGFDVPYEQWQLFPLASDQVLFVLEGRRRGESSDREVKILVRDHECKLLAPEERELTFLRENWLPPATLLRLLARAGYNFLLSDADAEYIPSVLPKTQEMEAKGYYDVALHCGLHAFASTRHNKMGEDPNMCLFRVSKEQRPADSDEPFFRDVDDDDKWHSIRYEKERCVIARFKDSDEDPDLSNQASKETHLNLYMTLESEYGKTVAQHTSGSNKLLQQAVLQLLTMTRPFTWG